MPVNALQKIPGAVKDKRAQGAYDESNEKAGQGKRAGTRDVGDVNERENEKDYQKNKIEDEK
ncbi:hypothetical protein EPN28_01430 [Patescibacteria group bacterium]|nr:MAG: hypothetical protein EPN28_01430 [Patescibacteria group bacterium]